MVVSLNIIAILKDHWPIISGIPTAAFTAYRLYRHFKRSRWTDDVVKAYRLVGQPVRVFIHDRKNLEWAVRVGRLEVVGTFPGGWAVTERMQLSLGMT